MKRAYLNEIERGQRNVILDVVEKLATVGCYAGQSNSSRNSLVPNYRQCEQSVAPRTKGTLMSETSERSMDEAERLERVAEIVSAYVSHNVLSPADLPAETHMALRSLAKAELPPVLEELAPAVPIKKSVMPDFLVCLDDGKKFKSLKRHLSVLGMTPDEYRAKWSLPSDYPMVAPNYAAIRSALAKSNGLGRKPAEKPLVSTKRTRKPKVDA